MNEVAFEDTEDLKNNNLIEEIRSKIIDELDLNGQYTLSAIFNSEKDPDWIEKVDFLTILVYNEMITCMFCKKHMEFFYEVDEDIFENTNNSGDNFGIEITDNLFENKLEKNNTIH